MKDRLRKLCILLLALVFLVSAAMVLLGLRDQRLAELANQEALRMAVAATPSPAPAVEPSQGEEPMVQGPEEPQLPEEARFLLETDLEALRQVNGDVFGWLHVPDSPISFPLLRSKDNKDYLTLTWDLQANRAGSIFLECENSPDLTDFHTLIYGHNMSNGSMFNALLDYRDQSYADEHPYAYVALEDTVFQYQVFSSYTARVTTDTYRILFEDDARKQSVIDYYLESSDLACDLVPAVEDRILTLSTCDETGSNATRFVVHLVLTGEFPR